MKKFIFAIATLVIASTANAQTATDLVKKLRADLCQIKKAVNENTAAVKENTETVATGILQDRQFYAASLSNQEDIKRLLKTGNWIAAGDLFVNGLGFVFDRIDNAGIKSRLESIVGSVNGNTDAINLLSYILQKKNPGVTNTGVINLANQVNGTTTTSIPAPTQFVHYSTLGTSGISSTSVYANNPGVNNVTVVQ